MPDYTVTIPTIGYAGQLPGLVDAIEAVHPRAELFLPCNGDLDDLNRVCGLLNRTGDPEPVWRRGENLYALWNEGLSFASRLHPSPIAVLLNDDIRIHPETLNTIVDWMRETGAGIASWNPYQEPEAPGDLWPREVTGTFRQGGIAGFAFAVRCDIGVRADPGFHWWGGDDDLVWSVRKAGFKAYVLDGLGVEHGHAVSASARPAVYEHSEQDRQRLLERWGETW